MNITAYSAPVYDCSFDNNPIDAVLWTPGTITQETIKTKTTFGPVTMYDTEEYSYLGPVNPNSTDNFFERSFSLSGYQTQVGISAEFLFINSGTYSIPGTFNIYLDGGLALSYDSISWLSLERGLTGENGETIFDSMNPIAGWNSTKSDFVFLYDTTLTTLDIKFEYTGVSRSLQTLAGLDRLVIEDNHDPLAVGQRPNPIAGFSNPSFTGGNLTVVPYDFQNIPGYNPSAVPEPNTMLLFGAGIASLAFMGRRRK